MDPKTIAPPHVPVSTFQRPTVDPAMRDAIRGRFGVALVDRPWMCDVMAANAAVIHAHNQVRIRNGEVPDPKYTTVSPEPGRLSDLLWNDFEKICRGVPELLDTAQQFRFTEIYGPSPNADIFFLDSAGSRIHVIGFRACLLHFLHAAYSKVWVLTSTTRDAGCLEEHDHILRGPDYTDTSLLAGFFNDIEMLFDRERLFIPISPPHWANPYDYCGRVEGTRRFLLAHELGHSVWPRGNQAEYVTALEAEGIEQERVRAWAEEIWCDVFAVQVLLESYGTDPLQPPALFDAQDVLCGVLTFTGLMTLVETVLVERGQLSHTTHPPFSLREAYIRGVIENHPICKTSSDLLAAARHTWIQMREFAKLAAGLQGLGLGDTWSYPKFHARLTPFGRAAHNAIFYKIAGSSFAPRLPPEA